jgi:hypothetical protein
MKTINTSFVLDPSIQQPLTTKSLDFLQSGNKQALAIICRNIIKNHGLTYSATVPYLLTTNMLSPIVPFNGDGTVFFNDEIYILQENTASALYAIIDTTPDATADPLLFSDLVNRNVHNNRYLAFTNTLAGSLFAISAIVDVSIPVTLLKPLIAYATSVPVTAISSSITVKFNNEETDAGTINNTSTGAITPAKLGNYLMSVNLSGSLAAAGSAFEPVTVYIYKNGASHKLVGQISADKLGGSSAGFFSGSFGVVVGNVADVFTVVIVNACTTQSFSTYSAYVAFNEI